MDNAASIAATALTAFSVKQNVAAGNIANVETPGYKAAVADASDVPGGGVAVSVRKTDDEVDISKEAASLLVNSNLYKANVATVKTADEMSKALLDIKA